MSDSTASAGPAGTPQHPGGQPLGSKRSGGPGYLPSIGIYYRQIVAELRKVIWPGRQDLITYTTVVIVFVVIMGLIIAAFDLAFSQGVIAVFGN